MTKINFSVLGVGAWGANFRSVDQLFTLLKGEDIEDDGAKGPKPEVIPANERRRAPLPVRLAIESSWQACQQAKLEPSELASVFVSGLGDTQLTDYMCKALAGETKALSPTKFHNSVHNAAAGYWTISTGCMQAANSVAGYQESVSLALMEGLLQAHTERRIMLLTFYDAPVSPVLKSLLKNEHAFSVSVIVAPDSIDVNDTHHNTSNFVATIDKQSQVNCETVCSANQQWADPWADPLAVCFANNPIAKILPFFELIGFQKDGGISMPLSDARSLHINRANS